MASDTVKVKVRGTHFHRDGEEVRQVKPGEEITVSKQRAAEGRGSGIFHPEKEEEEQFWTDSLGNKRRHTGLLQQEGRPNEEPPPESDSPRPGDGTFMLAPVHEDLQPGEVNQEAPTDNEIVSPAPGTGEFAVQGKEMLVENPDSLLPESMGITRDPAETAYEIKTAEKATEIPMDPVDPVSTQRLNEESEAERVQEVRMRTSEDQSPVDDAGTDEAGDRDVAERRARRQTRKAARKDK